MDNIDAIAKPQLVLPPLTGPYVFIVQFDAILHDLSSFFCKPTYRVPVLIAATSNTLLTMMSSLDARETPDVINKVLLQPNSKGFVKRIFLPQMRAANCKVQNIEEVTPLQIRIRYLRIRL